MGKFQKYINTNVLSRVAHLNTTSVLVRIVAGILTSKAIAVLIGVEGMALIGNLRNFLSAVHATAVLGFYHGLVKFIAEVKEHVKELSKTISTAFYVGYVSTLLVAFISYYNADFINGFLFSENYNYTYVIKIMAIALPFYSLNLFCFAIMNGFLKFKMMLVINIIGQFLGLGITLFLIYQSNIDGALVAAVLTPSLLLLMTFVAILNQRSLISLIKISNVDLTILKKFLPFATMALVSAIAVPTVSIFIRNYIIEVVGMKEAGYWEAMNRISDYCLMFIMSLMNLYFLPRFSEIENKREFRKEVFNFYKSILPYFAAGLLLVYLLRSLIVRLVFSEAFAPATELFMWQLLGDFVKVLSVVIAFQFIAKRMFWHFVIIEVFLVCMMYLTSVYLIDIYGVKGAVIGHFVSYVLFYGLVLLIFSSSLFGVIQEEVPKE
ncbi:MAG TPA: O-antigen translocase [Aquaticitalea sp.]|nr:O-antigen translocase [Aquaticitalea sp.]